VFGLLTLVYVLTAQRGASWQDSGRFQYRVINGSFTDSMGLALSHPLYILLAKGFSYVFWGNVLWAVSAFSGVGAAVAAANLYLLARWTNATAAQATVVAVAFGLTPTVWWLSTVAEVYTASIALLSTEILLVHLLTRSGRAAPSRSSVLIGLLGLTQGLHFSDHNFALVTVPVVGVLLWVMVRRRDIRRRQTVWWFVGLLVGSLPIIVIFIRDLHRTRSVVTSLRSLLVGDYLNQILSGGPLVDAWRNNLPLVALNAMTVVVPFGVWVMFRRRIIPTGGDLFRIYLVAATVLHIAFFIRYSVPDLFTFALPSLLLLTAWTSTAVHRLPKLAPAVAGGVAVNVVALWILPAALAVMGIHRLRKVEVPHRNEAAYWIQPWKQSENSAERFSKEIFALPVHSAVLADDTRRSPLLAYRQATGSRRDLDLVPYVPPDVPPHLFQVLSVTGHPMFVVMPAPADLTILRADGDRLRSTAIPNVVSLAPKR
jgi:hypothetical protein